MSRWRHVPRPGLAAARRRLVRSTDDWRSARRQSRPSAAQAAYTGQVEICVYLPRMSRSTRTLWASLNTLGLAFALVCNGLANALPLNGMNTGQISALYPNLFVPAGLTFAIWALIYSWLLVFAGAGFVAARRDAERHVLERIGPWFLINTLANGAWIFAWHWLMVPLSLALMLVILTSLIAMYLRLGTGVYPADRLERWALRAPISLYLGWITVATIANVTALAVELGAPKFGPLPTALTVLVIATAVAITARMLVAHHDLIYTSVVCWALLGIVLERSGAPDEGSDVVLAAAATAFALLALAACLIVLRERQKRATARRA